MLDTQDRDIRDMPDEEQWAIGKAMYERDILPRLTDADNGMYVVMDMLSGDYEMDVDCAVAGGRLERRRPDAVLHFERVGQRVPFKAVSVRFVEGLRGAS